MTTHYVVDIEATTTPPGTGELDELTEALAAWHIALGRSAAGNLTVTLTVPADNIGQAIATALAVVTPHLDALGLSCLPEQTRDERQGWDPVPPLLSVTEAAERLGVSRQRVAQMIHERKLPATRIGNTFAVPANAVPSAVQSALQRRILDPLPRLPESFTPGRG